MLLFSTVALASAQGVDTVPTSILRTSAFLAQHPCHSLETYTRLGYIYVCAHTQLSSSDLYIILMASHYAEKD